MFDKKKGGEEMIQHKRLIATFVAVLILFSLFFSIYFVALKTNHECTGEDCPICHEIQSCLQTIRTLIVTIPATAVMVAVLFYLVQSTLLISAPIIFRTLVSLKVKLSN
jgi:hypothetical protein